MNRSTKSRYVIFQILTEVFKKNSKFELVFNKLIIESNFNQNDITFIHNVCLNTMRRSFHCKSILKKFVKTNLKSNEFILLSSAIVQIVYLNVKPYAVVNETVNVAKKVKIFSGFINATLKNITKNVNEIKKTKIKLNDFPDWFVSQINLSKNMDLNPFLKTFYNQPSLHLVFKSEDCLNNFNEPKTKSSVKSAFVDVKKKLKDINNFDKGEWWVQDFSSMLPLAINDNIRDKNVLDICAAPGGKAFQLLANNKVLLNDISSKRIKRLKENIARLKFNPEISNLNGLDFNEDQKFDIVILDSPCSSIGTIRRHPEILFKAKKPNFKNLNKLQENLLQKSSRLVKNKGKIIYMVCSFFYSETLEILGNFLRKNSNFSIERFKPNNEFLEIKNLISKEGYFLTIPTKYKNFNIDGFFSVQLVKND